LCDERISSEHRHLLEITTREVRCVCYACSVLFDREAASRGKLKLIPDRRLYLADFRMSDAEWERLRVPVAMAFVFHSTPLGQAVAYYPAPMGATQALLEADVWHDVLSHNSQLSGMLPDVEALLINRIHANRDYYLVPIDDCFRLVATIRTTWHGLTGGQAAWRAIDDFFAALRARAKHTRDNACQISEASA
jgi:hypothetical protein